MWHGNSTSSSHVTDIAAHVAAAAAADGLLSVESLIQLSCIPECLCCCCCCCSLFAAVAAAGAAAAADGLLDVESGAFQSAFGDYAGPFIVKPVNGERQTVWFCMMSLAHDADTE
jgi:hypothetical protein